jgi:hypothetical protein
VNELSRVNLGEAVLKNLPPSQNRFLSVLRLVFFPSAPLCGRFCYGSSCVSLLSFVHFVTALRAFGRPSCQLVLHFVWAPILPTGLALPLVAQPWPVSSCVFLRLFVRLGAHVEKSPCVALGHPSSKLALRCVQAPNLGEGVLKNLPPSQNWFLSVIHLVFFPSAPLCGRFRYSSSCFSLRPFVRFVTALRAFGRPSCQLALHCFWVPLLPTRLALPLVRLLVCFVTAFRVFRCPSCELALTCVRAPNLGEAVLKNLPPRQNCFLSIIRLVFLPSAPFCGRFRCGSSCVSLRPFVCFVTALRAFGRPSCQLALHCVWVPLLPTRLALPLVRLLVRFIMAFRVFGCPSCELALTCVRAPNLGEAVLKNLPPSQNFFLSVIRLVFFPSAPFCGRFRCDSSCVSLRPFVRFVMAIRVFGRPSCQLALHCVWVPLLPTRLALPLVPNLGQAPRVFRYGSSCVWAPMLRTRLALRSGAHLANSPCVAFGHPTLVRPY